MPGSSSGSPFTVGRCTDEPNLLAGSIGHIRPGHASHVDVLALASVAYHRAVTTSASKSIPAYVHDILTDKPTAYLATNRPAGRVLVT